MANAYFSATAASGRFLAAPDTAGPWDPDAQHGGPPSALLVWVAEHVAVDAGRRDLVAVRYAAEFVRPVPVSELDVAARMVRSARSGMLVALSLAVDGRVCLEARVWLVRAMDTAAIAHPLQETPVIAPGRGIGMSFPYADSIDWRSEHGSLVEPGPAIVWARPRIPVLLGEPMSGLQRAVLIGDSASGVSAELDWGRWTFLNVDLDVHLARPVQGHWLRMDARTQLGAHGSALARSTLSDVAGPVGGTAQTLVLAPRGG